MNKLPQRMQGVWLTGHGGFEMLEHRHDIPLPQPGPGEVLIRIAAAAINNTDINTRTGWYSKSDQAAEDASWGGQAIKFPRIQGADVCGTIVAVGRGVDEQRVTQRVLVEPCLRQMNGTVLDRPAYFGSECDGGFAQYTVVASIHAHQIQSELTDAELASFPCSYSTAENLLTRSNVSNHDRVLITGASGGVGSAAIQLAKARGATVVAVTSPDKADALLDLGADQIVDRAQSLAGSIDEESIDVVIDLVGGPAWPELLDILRPFGRYAVAGAIAGPMVELDLRTLYLKDLSLFGCTILGCDVFSNLVQHIQAGRIAPVIAATFPLEQIVDAQKAFLAKQHIGKMVLTIDD